ncbi:Phosphoadenylyl-sulfate reductase [Fulvivirga imtechensis AK7]|uniref:Adenosine 5'-phosphosulfate reductase n=1 Tax=Fulvivirga imtechensis AK7 TaxID=1237149 RepID=L8JNG5_9BACT|nr:phosphoadenylyl-sulfate reductase [Fulvivirga imtechensis]ELR69074.1 Phosphoadenylyl-sulfate reductase [Fulvivirga imtechensis AK7]
MRTQENWFREITTDQNFDISEANEQFGSLSPKERLENIFQNFKPEEILITSSFGGSSVVLLHMLSQVKPGHPIHFINTSFHFKETLEYRDQLTRQLNLNVVDISAKPNKNRFTHENKTWKYNQDLCCFINKVAPLSEIKSGYKVWISGLMAFQNENRRNIKILEPKGNQIKVHPLIDMSSSDVDLYQLIYELPAHPLTSEGYASIGCHNCTSKGRGRNGRWSGTAKTECGLHS